jgi:uncharacterized membrane protein (DUF485 family)
MRPDLRGQVLDGGGRDSMTTNPQIHPSVYVQEQEDPDFIELKRRYRGFSFPMTVAFLAWYFVFVLLSIFAHNFMGTKVWGNITVGLILGVGQFVSTALITWLYVRHANTKLDPVATVIRERIEGGAQ